MFSPDSDKVMCVKISSYDVKLSVKLIRQSVTPGNMISSDIIMAYAALLNQSGLCAASKTFILPCYWPDRLMSDVFRPRLLHQLGCRLSNVDTLVVPICRAFHWILVVFDLANTRITVYDSMPAYRGYFTHALKPAAEILDKLKKVTMYIYIYLYIYICVCICMCKRVYINIFTEFYVSNTLGKEHCRIINLIIARRGRCD